MEPPLVVIYGPTASGKSSLALTIAECYNGEIICADSRTVYKDLSIGTAKPSWDDRSRVPHYGLDLVEPGERFTAYDFKQYAVRIITDIRRRGKLPILVGGTGLYIDSVVFDYTFPAENNALRNTLRSYTTDDLVKYCYKYNISLPLDTANTRHFVSHILRYNAPDTKKITPIDNTVIVGIATENEMLRNRIHARSEALFKHGLIDEAVTAGVKYGWDNEAMTGNVYPLVHQYVRGLITEIELRERFEISDRQLAKRQMTWLKRNRFIHWYPLSEAEHYLHQQLAPFAQS